MRFGLRQSISASHVDWLTLDLSAMALLMVRWPGVCPAASRVFALPLHSSNRSHGPELVWHWC